MSIDRSSVKGVLFACFIALSLSFSGACSLPRIIILNDPLSAEEHAKLGRVYEAQGKPDLAAQQYEAAVKRDPKSVSSLLLLAEVSFRTENFEAAENAYKKAASLQPGNGDIYNNLCWVYLKQGRSIERAEDLIRKAIAATPEHRGYYLDTRGMVLLKLNRVADSITALREAVGLIPSDQTGFLAEAYAHLAEAYGKSGDSAAAEEAARTAESLRGK